MEPAAVTAGPPSAAARPEVPAPRAELPAVWLWPGRPAPAPDPQLDPVVDALIASWRSPEADAQPQPAVHSPPEPVLEAGL